MKSYWSADLGDEPPAFHKSKQVLLLADHEAAMQALNDRWALENARLREVVQMFLDSALPRGPYFEQIAVAARAALNSAGSL